MPRFPVKTVALFFRDSYINAADLKIFYEPTPSLDSLDVWHGEEDMATFEVTTACLNENCQNCHVSNLFDDSIYSFYFSHYNDECYDDPNKHLMTTFEVFKGEITWVDFKSHKFELYLRIIEVNLRIKGLSACIFKISILTCLISFEIIFLHLRNQSIFMQLLCIKGSQEMVIPTEMLFHHHNIVALPVQQHSTTSA